MLEPEPAAAGGREWTPEQWRAIERRHGDLLLDAGAGSGKTSVLVERFVRAVLVDGVEVSAILTITFTEKAAAELRDRIRMRLRELGADEAARQTEGAFISTIHGFCARVLRAHALAAGLDPQFTVLDRDISDPLAALAFDDALEELARAGAEAVDLVAAHGAGALRSTILSVYAQLRSAGAARPRLPSAPPPGAEGTSALRAAAIALAAELGAIADPGARVVQALERLQRCQEMLERDRQTVWPGSLWTLRLPRNGAALSTDACSAYAEALEAFRSARAAEAAGPVRDLLDRLLVAFGEHYDRRKRAVSGVDFEDLELMTRDLLTGDEELRERYAVRFESIMVDELQDTNAVQLELIQSIARDNLFTVGDAQQSIYGFRHADVSLFRARGERLAARGARQTLQTNFRSRPEILAALNRAFEPELGESFMALHPGRSAGPGEAPACDGEPRVELLVVDKGADWELEGLAAPWRLAEARTLATRVAELVDAGTSPGEIVVLMRATTDMRAYERALEARGLPTYVIGGRGYWNHPQVVDLVAYLRALANPLDEEALLGVLASPLVGASLDALVVLAAEARESERELWRVVCAPGNALESLVAEERDRVATFAAWFAAQRERVARASIEELIDDALAITGYDLAMLAMPGGTRRLANVRKLMRLARAHAEIHGPDLRGFLALLDDRRSGRSPENREGEAPVEGDGLDAIRLMTIHRAKGLEFPIVCVADLGRSPGYGADILRVSGERLGLRLARPGGGGRESAWEYGALGSERRQAEESEERRLFYVAMTRAQERLVLSGAARFEVWQSGTGRQAGPIAWIAPAFVDDLPAVVAEGGGAVRAQSTEIAVRVGRPEDLAADAQASAAGPPAPASAAPPVPAAAVPPAARVPFPAVPTQPARPGGPPVPTLSYSSLGEYARCGYRFYAERVLGLPPVSDPLGPRGPRGGARSAADRGVLAHALLERLDFRRPVMPAAEAIVAAAARAGLAPAPGPEECDELIALVRGFASTELCARLGRATDTRREERFAFALSDDPADPTDPLIVGVLDVLAREPTQGGTRALVVDYKSDRLGAADPASVVRAAYETQRLIYALAALQEGAAEAQVAHCFLERPDEPVIHTFRAEQLPELRSRLRALGEGVIERRFPVTAEPQRSVCAGCPAEGGLCSWPLAQTRRESADRLF